MGSRSKMQGTPWHYENHWEANVGRSAAKPYEYPYQYKRCYFQDDDCICQNSSSKYYNQPCEGFLFCVDFSLTGIQKKKGKK